MDDTTAHAVMQAFGKAYFARDAALLAQVITPDAQWHFAMGADAPHGRVRVGVAGFLQGIAENEALFEKLRFEQVVCQGLGADKIVMTYLVNGQHRGGSAFSLRGVELITVVDGRVALKDVFWKQYHPT
jgi:ketosteroid isomerase-like protein